MPMVASIIWRMASPMGYFRPCDFNHAQAPLGLCPSGGNADGTAFGKGPSAVLSKMETLSVQAAWRGRFAVVGYASALRRIWRNPSKLGLMSPEARGNCPGRLTRRTSRSPMCASVLLELWWKKTLPTTKVLLWRMAQAGLVVSLKGKYVLPGPQEPPQQNPASP